MLNNQISESKKDILKTQTSEQAYVKQLLTHKAFTTIQKNDGSSTNNAFETLDHL